MGRCNQIYNVGQTRDKLISGFSDFSAVMKTRVNSTNGLVLAQFFQNILWDLYSYTEGKKNCFHHLFLQLEKDIVWKMPILRLFLPIEEAYFYRIFFPPSYYMMINNFFLAHRCCSSYQNTINTAWICMLLL